MPTKKEKKSGGAKKDKPITIPAGRKISVHVFLRVQPLNKSKDLEGMTVDGLFYIKKLLTTTFPRDVFTQEEWKEKIKDLLSKNR